MPYSPARAEAARRASILDAAQPSALAGLSAPRLKVLIADAAYLGLGSQAEYLQAALDLKEHQVPCKTSKTTIRACSRS